MTTTYTVPSKSNPGEGYKVEQFDDGAFYCPCLGFKWRSKCRHVTAIVEGKVAPDPGECAEPAEGDTSFNVEELE